MTNIVLLEYLSAKHTKSEGQEQSLLKEGLRMANNLILDFKKNPEVKKIIVVRNKGLRCKELKKVLYLKTNSKFNLENFSRSIKKYNPKVIVIAPENNFLLLNIITKLNKLGLNVINSNSKSLKIFSSKINTSIELSKKKIPCIETYKNINEIKEKKSKFIIKPIVSCGSENTYIVKNFMELETKLKEIDFPYIIQKYRKNQTGSFSMLCHNGNNLLLSCNEQLINIKNNNLKQVGIIAGGYEKYRKEFQKLANQLTDKYKGLLGYVGVDVLLHNNIWKIIEVNLRFTSSYNALKKAYGVDRINEIINFYCNKKINKNKLVKEIKKVKLIF